MQEELQWASTIDSLIWSHANCQQTERAEGVQLKRGLLKRGRNSESLKHTLISVCCFDSCHWWKQTDKHWSSLFSVVKTITTHSLQLITATHTGINPVSVSEAEITFSLCGCSFHNNLSLADPCLFRLWTLAILWKPFDWLSAWKGPPPTTAPQQRSELSWHHFSQ